MTRARDGGGRLVHEHRWQPGPLLSGHRIGFTGDSSWPTSVVLVCPCGALARLAVPQQFGFPRKAEA